MNARATERIASSLALACWVAAAGACSPVGSIRYRDQAPVWRVDDRQDIPKPRTRIYAPERYHFDYWFYRPAARLLQVPEPRRAANVNALDEVPDSTWFTNRVGRRELTREEIRLGPNELDGPADSEPWRIKSAKSAGTAPGFLMEDARGELYLLKFDAPGRPEVETGAAVIVQRLLWAVGYNVPEDSVVLFTREQLVLRERGATKEVRGEEVPLTQADVDAILARAFRLPDGRYRGLASKYLGGKPVGPFAPEGRRKDDANDRVRHEDRRDLRGQYVFFGWLAHSDLHDGNRLDMWVEDPERKGQHYLVHYLLDFNKALGAFALTEYNDWDNYAHTFDYGYAGASLLTLGLWRRPWEGIPTPSVPGVGRFDAEHFDPEGYAPRDYYMPFLRRDRFDEFWAAKVLMRLTPANIRAAVEAAKYSDPRTTEYLVRVLVERQRKSGRVFLSKVNPLDAFEVVTEGSTSELCGTDLLIHHRLVDPGVPTSYDATAYDHGGRAIRWKQRAIPARDGRSCLPGLRAPAHHDGYTIVGITTSRGDETTARVWVHLAADPQTEELRVIGVRRE